MDKNLVDLYNESHQKNRFKTLQGTQVAPASIRMNGFTLGFYRPEDLTAAPDIQRFTDPKRGDEIGKEFSPDGFKPVNVTQDGDVNLVTDGLHGAMGMMRAGYNYIPAIVVKGDRHSAGKAFLTINEKRKRVAVGTKAKVTANTDSGSLDFTLVSIIQGHGYKIDGPPGKRDIKVFDKVGLIINVYTKNRAYARHLDTVKMSEFDRAFGIAKQVFVTERLRTNTVIGLTVFLAKWKGVPFSDQELVDFLKAESLTIKPATKTKTQSTFHSQTKLFRDWEVRTSSNERIFDFVSTCSDRWNAWPNRSAPIPAKEIREMNDKERIF